VIAALAVAASVICGSKTATVHVPDNSYYTIENSDTGQNTTCVSYKPGSSGFKVTSTDQHKPWGYPSVVSGWDWGVYSRGGGAYFRYPVREDEDGNPVSSLAVWMHGAHGNGSWDIWFSKTDAKPVGQDNGSEVMIWIEHPGVSEGNLPAVTIDGIHFRYMTWTATAHGTSWHYIAYIAVSQSTHRDGLALNPFFHDAISRHLLSPDWYLDAIDGGTELVKGGSGVQVNMTLKGVN
jgi:hypothetical protein